MENNNKTLPMLKDDESIVVKITHCLLFYGDAAGYGNGGEDDGGRG